MRDEPRRSQTEELAVNIPSRLSQQNFERFRQIIQNAADVGRTVEVTAADMAPSTLAARLRDGLLSYRKFHWGDSSPRPEWCRLSVYTDQQGRVFIGTTKPESEPKQVGEAVRVSNVAETSSWSEEELRAVCFLISNKKIAGGITTSLISPQLCSTLELDYDIAITHEPNASIIF